MAKYVKVTNVDGKEFTFEMGHTDEEWTKVWGDNEDLWSFPIEELMDGTIDPNADFLYWFADGRLYETEIAV